MENIKQCTVCEKLYAKNKNVSKKIWAKSKYCSLKCRYLDLNSKPLSEERKKRQAKICRHLINNETPEQRYKRTRGIANAVKNNPKWHNGRAGKIGNQDPNWKGNNATYNAKHRWIQKHWKKTGICEDCGTTPNPYGRRKYGTEWANISGAYDRDNRNDWKELCKKCHIKIDNN